MNPTHSLLQRQLRRRFRREAPGETPDAGPALPAGCQEFLSEVNEAYWQFDEDRRMLERSLELSSQELIQANSELRALVSALPDLFLRLDRQGRVLESRAALHEDLPLPAEQLLGRPIQEVPWDGVGAKFAAALAEVDRTHALASFEYDLDLRGRRSSYEARVLPLPSGQFVVLVRNITERRELEEALRHQAHHDPLTGLPNRLLVRDRVGIAIERARRRGEVVAILFVDIDSFKAINDTLGHTVGDRLLEQVAHRLAHHCRASDTLGRVGGDEFLFAIDNLRQPEDCGRIADAILTDLLAPFEAEGHEIHVTAAIGISLFPLDGGDPETLIRHADIALYRAKAQGRSSFRFYTPDMNLRTLDRLLLETQLRRALRRDELILHYQPQFGADGEVAGLETLVRWAHPDGQLRYPDSFIAVAEETGAIDGLGEWVLRQACAQAQRWWNEGYAPVRLAVNLSPRQFLRGRPVELVGEVLTHTGLDPALLEIELTENAIMHNPELGGEILAAFRALRVSVAIDDFGTGYSSLSSLKRLPITTLKIDKSFVASCERDATDGAIVTAIIAMAHSLGLNVVGEGVENAGQRNFLLRQGCDQLQGYYLGRPMDAAAVERLLRRAPR